MLAEGLFDLLVEEGDVLAQGAQLIDQVAQLQHRHAHPGLLGRQGHRLLDGLQTLRDQWSRGGHGAGNKSV